jgi:trypanothione synthetase/amidase
MFRVAEGCVPYGEQTGIAPGGIPAISNGNDYFFSGERNVVNGAVTGFKYQCVEFARRWLLQRKGLWLPDVAWAAHVFSFTEVLNATTAEKVKCLPVANGKSSAPVVDSLLIYRQGRRRPRPHRLGDLPRRRQPRLTEGKFGERDMVYQELFQLPKRDD